MSVEKLTCRKCGKTMNENQFYTYKDGRKTELCKACLTMHIDNYNPDTFLWLLEKMDVPYVPEEWNILRDRAFAKDPKKMNGMSVFGKYLSKMKLKQWAGYGWADSDRIQRDRQAVAAERQREFDMANEDFEAMLKEKFEAGEITEAEYKTLMPRPVQYQDMIADTGSLEIPDYVAQDLNADNMFNEDFFMKESELPNPGDELTYEDKIYLAMKWGRLYKPNEWVELEKMYADMEQSFDIQDTDTKNSLIFICKLNLKANQALDSGDYDSYSKLSRSLNDRRKSANFTAAQRKKQEKNDFVDSVGSLVAYCEKNGGRIPKFEFGEPIDIIDKVIKDMKDYTKSLIYEDATLANQIENYIKQRERIDQERYNREHGIVTGEVTDQDIADFEEDIRAQKAADEIVARGGVPVDPDTEEVWIE